MQRCVVHYCGRVQGVGFRYAACRIAQRYAVSGYVCNLPDGRVELTVEGDPQEIAGLLKALAAELDEFIEEIASRQEPASGEFSGFAIRR